MSVNATDILAASASDGSELCHENSSIQAFKHSMDSVLLGMTIASSVCNVLVIVCASKLLPRRGDTMHVFIVSMTMGDMLLTAFAIPNELVTRIYAVSHPTYVCSFVHFVNWLGLAVSGLSLTLLNVDKLIYFRWPLKYLLLSKKRALYLCFLVFSISFSFVGYVWVFDIIYIQNDENCVLLMSDGKAYFYQVFTTVFCVVPVVSSLALSIYLFRLTRRRRASLNLSRRQTGSSTLKLKLESLAFIFATTLWTACSLLPYRVFNVCRIYLFQVIDDCEWEERFNWVGWSLMYLLLTNAIVNPFITLFVYAPYRRTLLQLMTPRKGRQARSTLAS